MATATINVPVTGFVAIGTGAGICSNGVFTLQPGSSNRVTIDANNFVKVANKQGHGNGRIQMDFVVTSAEPQPKTYSVCGFIITNGGLSSATPGNGNFSLNQINGTLLSLTNHYTKGMASWKLFIAISHMPSTGVLQVGLVDPGIENTDQD